MKSLAAAFVVLGLYGGPVVAGDFSNDSEVSSRLPQIERDARRLETRLPEETHPATDAGVEMSRHLVVWRGHETHAFTSSAYTVGPFDRAVMSWNAKGSATFELGVGGQWFTMGKWGDKQHSVKTKEVDVDTLRLDSPAQEVQFRVTPEDGAEISLVAITFWRQSDHGKLSNERSPVWGKKPIDVPRRAQFNQRTCSPTSLSMVLEFYGFNKPTTEVSRGVFDPTADNGNGVYGNWPFNTAYAFKVSGIESYVRRMDGLQDVEKMIADGRPVIITVHGAPHFSDEGHLVVVVGFDRNGDVVVNNPGGGVRRTYTRADIHKAWMGREEGSGITYVLHGPIR